MFVWPGEAGRPSVVLVFGRREGFPLFCVHAVILGSALGGGVVAPPSWGLDGAPPLRYQGRLLTVLLALFPWE